MARLLGQSGNGGVVMDAVPSDTLMIQLMKSLIVFIKLLGKILNSRERLLLVRLQSILLTLF